MKATRILVMLLAMTVMSGCSITDLELRAHSVRISRTELPVIPGVIDATNGLSPGAL